VFYYFSLMDMDGQSLTQRQLRIILKGMGLSSSGLKSALVKRYNEAKLAVVQEKDIVEKIVVDDGEIEYTTISSRFVSIHFVSYVYF